jgi:hypothetical protein
VICLLLVMLALIAANAAAMNRLTREVKGLEKRQIQRLAPSPKPVRPSPTATNLPPAS